MAWQPSFMVKTDFAEKTPHQTRNFTGMMNLDYSKLKISLFFLLATIAFGTVGYVMVEDMPFFEAFYMTLITISTVGFSEVRPLSPMGRGITIIIIVCGISLLTYTLGQVARIFVEGELRKILGRRKLEKQIAALKDHYIVCGYGRIGSIIVQELKLAGIPLVVIEQNPEQIEVLEAEDILYLNLDATSDEALVEAGLDKARGLVTAVSSDADNVFIALSAKGMRSDIFILARASDVSNENKLLRAGASRVVCPYQIGGERMAGILQKPTVIDFLDQTLMNNELGLKMEEAVVARDSSIAGKTVLNSKLRQDFGVIIVAIKKLSGEMIFNPGPDEQFDSGDVIVVIGKREEVRRMAKAIG
ncbi:potassium transporter TrkA [Desulfomarina profundi]|uniref:Potassium transporter TrkA n=1 Tax=Desulfomarina profundi TaxID=2772557 RepID=A0A8D5JIF5_9BACT|nr:potassium channel protein [Desulfomarina profundi]BCL62629.1 potassium transporter TrkA [Desulfomarina profundi]